MNFFVLFDVFVVYYLTVVAYYSCKIFVGNLSAYITKYLTAVLYKTSYRYWFPYYGQKSVIPS